MATYFKMGHLFTHWMGELEAFDPLDGMHVYQAFQLIVFV